MANSNITAHKTWTKFIWNAPPFMITA